MPDALPGLMRLPSEIRLMIYDLLLDDKGHKTIEIGNQESDIYRKREKPFRSSYRVIGHDLARQSHSTTYHVLTDLNLHMSIMRVNRKIHEEATHRFYTSHAFNFGRSVEAVVPFFSDLTAQTRLLIRDVSLVKKGEVYSRDYDRCEWANLCDYMTSSDVRLENLRLTIEGGRPSLGWDEKKQFGAADFYTMERIRYEPLDWVWQMLSIKGIQTLQILSDIRHCPPSQSNAMSFFAAFSSSIETGFADYLRGKLLSL